jgi:hypothetical protein
VLWRLVTAAVGNRTDVDSDDTLRPAEALDSDADHIAEEPEGESLDEKLAAEEPDASVPAPDEAEDVDHIDPAHHGTDEGQISGSPEDGDSIFPVVE